MSVIESPSNSQVQQEVDQTHKAARVSLFPLEHRGLEHVGGHFRLSARSGVLTGAGIIANAPLFSLRWTEQQTILILLYLEAFLVPTLAFTANQELGLNGVLASDFSANDSAGTEIVLASGNRVRRADMNPSDIGHARIAAATLLTAGTRTLDANPFIAGSSLVHDTNPAAATEKLNTRGGPIPFGFRYKPDLREHPITLRRNEGIIVRNTVAFPAAGNAVLTVNAAWIETSAL